MPLESEFESLKYPVSVSFAQPRMLKLEIA